MDLKSQDFGVTHQEEGHQEQHFHVLAVDDSLIERKLLERLLTISSYQGIHHLCVCICIRFILIYVLQLTVYHEFLI